MIILTSVNRKLQVVLGAAATTNNIPVIVHFEDVRAQDDQQGYGCQINNSNDTTQVVICTAPTGGVTRLIKSLSIWQADTTTATVTVSYNDNGTLYTVFKAALASGDQVFYEDQSGWQVLDSTGAIK